MKLLLRSIIIIPEFFFLIMFLYFSIEYLIYPESVTLGCECISNWSAKNGITHMIFNFINIILSLFIIIITATLKFSYYPLLFLLLTAHYCFVMWV
jgi:hypothetical protein